MDKESPPQVPIDVIEWQAPVSLIDEIYSDHIVVNGRMISLGEKQQDGEEVGNGIVCYFTGASEGAAVVANKYHRPFDISSTRLPTDAYNDPGLVLLSQGDEIVSFPAEVGSDGAELTLEGNVRLTQTSFCASMALGFKLSPGEISSDPSSFNDSNPFKIPFFGILGTVIVVGVIATAIGMRSQKRDLAAQIELEIADPGIGDITAHSIEYVTPTSAEKFTSILSSIINRDKILFGPMPGEHFKRDGVEMIMGEDGVTAEPVYRQDTEVKPESDRDRRRRIDHDEYLKSVAQEDRSLKDFHTISDKEESFFNKLFSKAGTGKQTRMVVLPSETDGVPSDNPFGWEEGDLNAWGTPIQRQDIDPKRTSFTGPYTEDDARRWKTEKDK